VNIFSKGDKVFLRDRPLGHPLKSWGIVVGSLSSDRYNVHIQEGALEGKVVTFRYWDLYKKEES